MRVAQRGFSLLELMVVVAIATALLAWTYPRLSVLVSKYRLDNAAWNLATELQKVRLRAIAENTRYEVRFNAGTGTYRIRKETSGGWTETGKSIDDAGLVALSATADPVFTSRGSLETACVVTLTGPSGGVRLVAAQLSGKIYVQ